MILIRCLAGFAGERVNNLDNNIKGYGEYRFNRNPLSHKGGINRLHYFIYAFLYTAIDIILERVNYNSLPFIVIFSLIMFLTLLMEIFNVKKRFFDICRNTVLSWEYTILLFIISGINLLLNFNIFLSIPLYMTGLYLMLKRGKKETLDFIFDETKETSNPPDINFENGEE